MGCTLALVGGVWYYGVRAGLSCWNLDDSSGSASVDIGGQTLIYVDDLVLLGPNKKKLHAARRAIANYLSGIGLQLKGNWQVFRVDDRGIDFLGLRFFRTHTILRKRNALRIRRRMRKIARKGHLSYRDACAVISYWGWIKRSNSYGFYHKHVKPVCSIGRAKEAVSRYALWNNQRREALTGPGGDS